MSLERMKVPVRLDPDDHAALKAVAEADQMDLGEWCERLIVAELDRRVHAARLIADRVPRPGKSGNGRESPGAAGK